VAFRPLGEGAEAVAAKDAVDFLRLAHARRLYVAMTLFSSSRFGGALVAIATLGAVACSSGSTAQGLFLDGGTSGTGTDGGSGKPIADEPVVPASDSCKSSYPASQSLSEPCCAERGADACGARLFCAAFDGRTQTTCYPERSRLDGETCTANAQCVGNACDPSGVCKAHAPPAPAKCPSSCTIDAECQATCPVSSGATACCDGASGICFAMKGTCPGP